jgi:hypothetical protein
MAKLGKQKFSIFGDHESGRTTFSGTIELYLYYSSEDDMFYFHPEELKKYIHEDIGWFKNVFDGCRTKQQAIDVVELLLAKEVKETKKLRIEIGMNSSLYKVKNPKHKESKPGTPMREWSFEEKEIIDPSLPEYLKNILERGGVYSGHGLTLSFTRIMELEINGMTRYTVCDQNWKYDRKNVSSHSTNLIDWTPEMEKFLLDTQQKLDNLCKLVLEFFNAGQDIQSLLKKVADTNSNKLLS